MKSPGPRLRKPAEFKKVFREGKRFLSPHFVLYARPNEFRESRLGIAISKKHLKLATGRNRLRRAGKEVFRNEINDGRNGHDFVVASRASCQNANLKRIACELRNLILEQKEKRK